MSSQTRARDELLTEHVLGLLNSHAAFRLIATPSTGLEEVAFPFLVYEAKSDSSSLFFAENQSAGGAAKALSLLQQLSSYDDGTDTLPVFAFASCGTLWEAFIAFYQEQSESYHLLPISRKLDQTCDIDIFHLQLMLLRIRSWVVSVYKPRVELMIKQLLTEYRGQRH
ncbi:hypothetical protein FA10DRAFT_50681 [Acaromyces ingoldii]|uniref:Uncharacterized protein n=1 Tax=Acaromyces ingoldii TaxID=215250 RepID=A0A316YDD8_9BASI|nr:hypothetical protein FA10DRAFT_50681 [Acaromyces ingoldii]PWN86678.1 hypothetical protein FA10DRAFT_50681 [Acaromyces ingoldii]